MTEEVTSGHLMTPPDNGGQWRLSDSSRSLTQDSGHWDMIGLLIFEVAMTSEDSGME